MAALLVLASVWYTGRRMESPRWQKGSAPLISPKAYLALFGAGLLLALLMR